MRQVETEEGWLDRPKYRSHEMQMGGLRLSERPTPAGVGVTQMRRVETEKGGWLDKPKYRNHEM